MRKRKRREEAGRSGNEDPTGCLGIFVRANGTQDVASLSRTRKIISGGAWQKIMHLCREESDRLTGPSAWYAADRSFSSRRGRQNVRLLHPRLTRSEVWVTMCSRLTPRRRLTPAHEKMIFARVGRIGEWSISSARHSIAVYQVYQTSG